MKPRREPTPVASPPTDRDPTRGKRVLLVDAHPLFRDGLRHLLAGRTGAEVVGEAGDDPTARPLLDAAPPDLLIVEPQLPGGTAYGLLARAKHLGTRVLVLSASDEVNDALAALEAGASGFVSKRDPPEVVVTAVRQLLAGYSHLPDGILTHLIRATEPAQIQGVAALSARERQVFELLGHGVSTKQVASRLRLKSTTVDTHRERIKKKLKLSNGAALNRFAIEWTVRRQLPTRPST